MDDILCSVAWKGDGWHQANYWIYVRGKRATYSVDWYSDGDHEPCHKRDLPSDKEVTESWLAYSRHVLETGQDPLGEFMVKRQIKRKERWEFRFRPSILGVVVQQARRAGRGCSPKALPAHVQEYLTLKPGTAVLTGFKNWRELAESVDNAKPGVWSAHTIENVQPRTQERITRDLRAAARRHLQRG